MTLQLSFSLPQGAQFVDKRRILRGHLLRLLLTPQARYLPHYLLVLGLQLGNQFALGSRVIRANGCGTVGQVGGLYLEKV